MAGQATELFNLASSFDPLSSYRQGQMTSQKFDIQQSVLDEQTKEIESEKAATLGQQAGQPGQPVALAKMTNQMIPDAKLYNDDGTMTVAGQMNEVMVNSTKLAKQSKMMSMQASLIEDPYQRVQAMAEARRLGQTAQADALKAREMNDKVKSDSIYAAAMSKDQTGWDAAIQAYQDTGLPLPQGIPTTWSPENAKKIAALAPAALQSKIRNDQLKEAEAARKDRIEQRKVEALEATNRDNAGFGGKEFKDVRGQLVGLRNYIPESQIKVLGAKEIPAVSSKLEAAELTDELAQLVKDNPKATGVVGGFFQNFERFLPDRYDAETSGESVGQKINSEIDKLEAKGKISGDEISKARLIAKKAVDVINARALAASGGGRVLVAELRLQKDVLGLDKLTPKSAPYVYSQLAESDRQSIKRYGIDPSTIKRNFAPISREESSSEKGGPKNIKAMATETFGSYEPKKFEYRINPETGKAQRREIK
jgi:hypothetical protein